MVFNNVTLKKQFTPMLISVLSPIRWNFRTILFLTVYHLEHYILRSYHCKVLSMFICKLSNVIWKVIAISCQQHLKKSRFQNMQNLFCRVEFLISIEWYFEINLVSIICDQQNIQKRWNSITFLVHFLHKQ